MALLNFLNIWNEKIIIVSMFFPSNYNIYITSELVSINLIFVFIIRCIFVFPCLPGDF